MTRTISIWLPATVLLCCIAVPVWAQDAAVDAEPASRTAVSFAEAFFIQRNPTTGAVEWLGSAITWLLLVLSLASLGYLGAKAMESRKSVIMPSATSDVTLSALRNSGAAVPSAMAGDESYLARILAAAFSMTGEGREAMVHAGEREAEERAVRMLRNLEPLNVAGAVAPMIGLFGTVYGMILAFREIVASGGSPDAVALAAGIGTALTTTFWGLVVAIPALTGYAFLRNAIDEHTIEAAREAERLIEIALHQEQAGQQTAAKANANNS